MRESRRSLVSTRIAIGLIALLAIGVGFYALSSPPPQGATIERMDTESESQGASTSELVGPANVVEATERAHAELADDTVHATASDATCILIGRVVDERDQALVGFPVRLQAWEFWAEDIAVDPMPLDDRYVGWTTATDSAGAFRFEVPPPTQWTVSLEVADDPYLSQVILRFGKKGRNRLDPIEAGTRDLGIIRLTRTGAIAGSVRDEGGQAIVDAEVRLGPTRVTTYGLNNDTTSRADGSYLIGHIPPGEVGIAAEHDEHLSQFQSGVAVRAGETTQGIDFTLTSSPTISGRVIDESGAPIAGARVWGKPEKGGSGAGAKSKDDGSFEVFLPQVDPYALEITCTGFDPIGVWEWEPVYEPGTKDLTFIMKQATMTTFVVLDAATDVPIESFGVRIIRNKGSKAARYGSLKLGGLPPVAEHPDGRYEIGARPGIDRFELLSPGYLELAGDVEHDLEAPGTQTLRLERGVALTGRVTLKGQPVPGETIVVVPVRIINAGSIFDEEWPSDPSTLQGLFIDQDRAWRAESDSEGRFTFISLEKGPYFQLTIREGSSPCARRLPVEVQGDEDVDLGDIELEPAAFLRARLLMPDGVDPTNAVFYLDDWKNQQTFHGESNGWLEIGPIGPGIHRLQSKEVPGVLAGGTTATVDLKPGETEVIELDLRDRATCRVKAHLVIRGVDPEGARVRLVPVGQKVSMFPGGGDLRLAPFDADGRSYSTLRTAGECRVIVSLKNRPDYELPAVRVNLVGPETVEVELRVEFTTVNLDLSGIQLPERGSIRIEGLGANRAFSIKDGELEVGNRGATWSEDGLLALDAVPTGSRTVSVRVLDYGAPSVRVVRDNQLMMEPPAVHESEHSVEAVAGEVVEIELR